MWEIIWSIKGKRWKKYSLPFQFLPSKVWIYQIRFLNVFKEASFPEAVLWSSLTERLGQKDGGLSIIWKINK